MNLQALRDQYDNAYIDASDKIKSFDFNCLINANVNVVIEAESFDEAYEKLLKKEFKNIDVDLNDVTEIVEMIDYDE